jgi:uncharacterized membrane protein YsdA (DUF1294 family)
MMNTSTSISPANAHLNYSVAQEGRDSAVRPYTSESSASMSALNEESKEKSLVDDYENVIFKMD